MESHYRLHCSAMHLMMDALSEDDDPVVRSALVRGMAFISDKYDATGVGAWFYHDELETSAAGMRRAPFKWWPGTALGKSPQNMLVLNTQLDTLVALERYRTLTGDAQYAPLVESGYQAARAVLALRPHGMVIPAAVFRHRPDAAANRAGGAAAGLETRVEAHRLAGVHPAAAAAQNPLSAPGDARRLHRPRTEPADLGVRLSGGEPDGPGAGCARPAPGSVHALHRRHPRTLRAHRHCAPLAGAHGPRVRRGILCRGTGSARSRCTASRDRRPAGRRASAMHAARPGPAAVAQRRQRRSAGGHATRTPTGTWPASSWRIFPVPNAPPAWW